MYYNLEDYDKVQNDDRRMHVGIDLDSNPPEWLTLEMYDWASNESGSVLVSRKELKLIIEYLQDAYNKMVDLEDSV